MNLTKLLKEYGKWLINDWIRLKNYRKWIIMKRTKTEDILATFTLIACILMNILTMFYR